MQGLWELRGAVADICCSARQDLMRSGCLESTLYVADACKAGEVRVARSNRTSTAVSLATNVRRLTLNFIWTGVALQTRTQHVGALHCSGVLARFR